MALAMRLSRGGRKARPFYRIVVADKRFARDGRYIERLGTYNPLLANDDEKRVVLNEERIKYWLGQGAKPSRRVQIFLGKAGIMDMPEIRETPQKSAQSEKTKMRIADKEEKKKAAEEAAKEAAAAPAEETPAEGEAAAETPAEEAKEEAPAEEAKEEAKTGEAPKEEEKAEDKPAETETKAEEEKKEG